MTSCTPLLGQLRPKNWTWRHRPTAIVQWGVLLDHSFRAMVHLPFFGFYIQSEWGTSTQDNAKNGLIKPSMAETNTTLFSRYLHTTREIGTTSVHWQSATMCWCDHTRLKVNNFSIKTYGKSDSRKTALQCTGNLLPVASTVWLKL